MWTNKWRSFFFFCNPRDFVPRNFSSWPQIIWFLQVFNVQIVETLIKLSVSKWKEVQTIEFNLITCIFWETSWRSWNLRSENFAKTKLFLNFPTGRLSPKTFCRPLYRIWWSFFYLETSIKNARISCVYELSGQSKARN